MPVGKNGNGQALPERFIPNGLSHAATAFVESLKIWWNVRTNFAKTGKKSAAQRDQQTST